jgi:putative transcriptional regulator
MPRTSKKTSLQKLSKDLKMTKYAIPDLDVEAVAKALEADFGESLPDIRQALTQAKSGTLGRVTTPAQMLVRQARTKAGLSQQAFADRIETPVATLRDWEQGRFAPPGGVLCLLRLISNHPELARELETA